MKFKRFLTILLVVFLILSCSACSPVIDSEDKKDLVNSHIKENFIVDSSVSYIFFDLDMVSHSIDSDETLKNVEQIQNWLDLNSNVEIIGIVGPISQNSETGCYILYKHTKETYNYIVYLSKTNFIAKHFNAACYIYNSNGDYYLIISHTDTLAEKEDSLAGVVEDYLQIENEDSDVVKSEEDLNTDVDSDNEETEPENVETDSENNDMESEETNAETEDSLNSGNV